ncbi:MAG: signal recognition particle receptor subunit alpha [Candidatus Altiarchaeota archaeon]
MAFEKLKSGLQVAVKGLRKAVVLDKKAIREYTKEIQKALIASDVNINLVLNLTKKIEERSLLEKPPGMLSRSENVVKVTYDELVNLLGEGGELALKDGDKVLLVGVQGSGKTTTAAKLARFYKKKGLNPKLICADTFRPAAYEQLKQLAAEIHTPFYGENNEKDTLKIIKNGMREFKDSSLIIIDSEGRHKLDKSLMDDINRVYQEIRPDRVLMVLDGTMGQQAGEQAKAFKESCKVDGILLSKLDGSAKGGGALSACAETGSKVYFLGMGEHIPDLEVFDPKRFVSRVLGYGDIEGLLEKAKEVDVDEESVKRMMSGKFTLEDLYHQIDQMAKMGPMDKVMEMIPGAGSIPKDVVNLQEGKVKKFKVIMDSMTDYEMQNPLEVKGSRVDRIAAGSGTSTAEVKELLNYYKKMRKMMKSMGSGRKLEKMMKRFGGLVGM